MMHVLTALLVGILPLYIVRFSILDIPTNAFEAAVWVCGINVLLFPHTRKAWIQSMQSLSRGYRIWIICFLVAAVISTMNSSVLLSSLGILKGWIITPMILGSLVYAFGNRPQIISSLALSGCVVALLGISQIEGFGRISALYDVPNSLALFLVPIAVLALVAGFQTNNKLLQLLSIPMLIAIIATQSFGAVFALLGTAIIAWAFIVRLPSPVLGEGEGEGPSLRSMKRGTRNALALFIIAVIAVFALSGRISYILSPITNPGTTNSATVRLQLWDIGMDLIKKNPVFGIGLGQFEGAYQEELHYHFAEESRGVKAKSYKLQAEYVFRDPHNFLIAFWLNVGLLGLISFIALNYIVIKSVPSPIALALISVLLFGLVDTIYWKNDLSALWWVLLALI